MKGPTMKSNIMKTMSLVLALFVAGSLPSWAQDSELDKLKANMEKMQKSMEEMQKKIVDLEKEKAEKAAAPAPSAQSAIERTSPSYKTLEKVAAGQDIGRASEVVQRPAMNDQQEAAQRSKD